MSDGVWLVYEDDYGGTFSPYLLVAVYPADRRDLADQRAAGTSSAVVWHEWRGGLDRGLYPPIHGGLFGD